jgi:hypothetical protein
MRTISMRQTFSDSVTYNSYCNNYHDANNDITIPTASLLTAVTSWLNMTSTLRKENNFSSDTLTLHIKVHIL